MFRGTSIVKRDAKGRVVVPSRFRGAMEAAEGDLAVTSHPEGFLLLMTQAKYEVLEEQVSGMPDNDERALYFKQTLIGMAESGLRLDKLGRVSLSAEQREHASIETEVALVGMRDHIRIWGAERLKKLNAAFRESREDGKMVLPEGWNGFKI
ncbi:MAG: hypothetical protein ISN26_04115 [Betaproteobacteria bacterium AqS2]|uniref:Transcriptional regulator MraZ n=1 Tax=Candidatus Amphirhobacter heronislandensis TaxID=1732024 RepID=A0A930UC78_9GAMM|nr:hypothetical protein [Betaproteobacteria bacterium AqS2]